MAWTQADLDALDAAIATGTKAFTTRHGDTMVNKEFHSLNDMRSLRAEMAASLTGTGAEPPRRWVTSSTRGL